MVMPSKAASKPSFAPRFVGVLALGLFVFFVTSCVLPDTTRAVLAGNQAYGRGDYQEATVYYLAALKEGETVNPYVAYNLANVYQSLGEVKAAHQLWEQALSTNDSGLRFSVLFNRGLAWFEAGRYQEAYDAYREALILNPSSIDTKFQLELAQERLQASPRSAGSTGDVAQTSRSGQEEAQRLLEYIRRKGGTQWIPRMQSGTETPASVQDW